MAISVVIPDGSTPSLTIGKVTRTWNSVADAVAWANDVSADQDVAFALAIRLAAARPALRGKTLTINPAAAANLVTVS